jgi:hypothetical protein
MYNISQLSERKLIAGKKSGFLSMDCGRVGNAFLQEFSASVEAVKLI